MPSTTNFRKPIVVPRYLVPVAQKLRDIEKIMVKGVVVNTLTVKSARQPDGRVQLRLRQ